MLPKPFPLLSIAVVHTTCVVAKLALGFGRDKWLMAFCAVPVAPRFAVFASPFQFLSSSVVRPTFIAAKLVLRLCCNESLFALSAETGTPRVFKQKYNRSLERYVSIQTQTRSLIICVFDRYSRPFCKHLLYRLLCAPLCVCNSQRVDYRIEKTNKVINAISELIFPRVAKQCLCKLPLLLAFELIGPPLLRSKVLIVVSKIIHLRRILQVGEIRKYSSVPQVLSNLRHMRLC